MLEFLDENLAASLTRRPRKHIVDDRPEVSVKEPRILKPKASTTRDSGASSEEKGDMVRAEACQGGEGGVREDCIPIHVNETPIEVYQSRLVAFVAPCVSPVSQRDFN